MYWHSDGATLLEKCIGTVTLTLDEKHNGTLTLYSRNIMAQWHVTRETFWHSERDALLKKNIGTVTVKLHSRASINFRPHFPSLLIDSGDHRYTDSPRQTIHNLCVLRSRCHERHTWLKAQNKTLPRFLHILSDSYKIRRNARCTTIYEMTGKFYENRLSKCHTLLTVENEFLTALPTFNVRHWRKSDKIIVT